jgi:hypothetical protein
MILKNIVSTPYYSDTPLEIVCGDDLNSVEVDREFDSGFWLCRTPVFQNGIPVSRLVV